MAYVQAPAVRPPVVGARVARVRTHRLGLGDVGSWQTLRSMRGAVRQAIRDPRVLETAAAIVRPARPRDKRSQAQLIRSWMAAHTRYLNDPPGLELLRTPDYQLDRIGRDGVVQGDCDDMAMLAAALGKAAGMRAQFVALGFQGPKGPLSHVFTELLADDGWVEMDVTRTPGRPVPQFTRRVTREV